MKLLRINLLQYILPILVCLNYFSHIENVYAEEKNTSTFKKSLAGKNTKDPVFIQSDTLGLNSKERIFTYKGNVKIKRGDVDITTDIMVGKYAENQELETIVCQGNVVVTRPPETRATSNRAYYNIKSGKIELTENPELAKGSNVLVADKIIMYVDEDKSEAEGNVRVKVVKAEGEDK